MWPVAYCGSGKACEFEKLLGEIKKIYENMDFFMRVCIHTYLYVFILATIKYSASSNFHQTADK